MLFVFKLLDLLQGWRRVTLGLRDIVHVEGLTQEVDTTEKTAVILLLSLYPSHKSLYQIHGLIQSWNRNFGHLKTS